MFYLKRLIGSKVNKNLIILSVMQLVMQTLRHSFSGYATGYAKFG